MTILAAILMIAGVFFLTVSSIGLIRLPDFYTRAHAMGKSETPGTMLILVGLSIYSGWSVTSLSC